MVDGVLIKDYDSVKRQKTLNVQLIFSEQPWLVRKFCGFLGLVIGISVVTVLVVMQTPAVLVREVWEELLHSTYSHTNLPHRGGAEKGPEKLVDP